MLLVDKSLQAIAKVASKDDSRPFLTGVNVTVGEAGTPRFEATDGHILIRAEETNGRQDLLQDFPLIEGMDATAEAAGTTFTIPAAAWSENLKAAGRRELSHLPILSNVAIAQQNGAVRIVSGMNGAQQSAHVTPTAGQFPNTEYVVKDATDRKPKATITFDARVLAKVFGALEALAGAGTDKGSHVKVSLEIGAPDRPMVIRAENPETGYTFTALVAPMRP